MAWIIHSGIIIGTEHERTKRNRQDFCAYFLPDETGENRYGGVICDGCSGGPYSEVGAALLGSFILNLIKKRDMGKPEAFKSYIEKKLSRFIHALPINLMYTSIDERVHFIHTFLLSTFIFAVIEDDRIIIGHSGDGVIIVNDQVKIIDQQGTPHYMAYRDIPEGFFSQDSPPGGDFFITSYSAAEVKRLAIASDGIIPLVQANLHNEIFGTRKRQLQRKLNVWQQKDRLFYDDISCVVFEKEVTPDEHRI